MPWLRDETYEGSNNLSCIFHFSFEQYRVEWHRSESALVLASLNAQST